MGKMPMPSRVTVNVIGKKNAYGLMYDSRIVIDLLNESGFDAQFVNADFFCGSSIPEKIKDRLGRIRQDLSYRFLPHRYPKRDLNIFLEWVPRHMFQAGRRQVLIPNQEWYDVEDEDVLPKFDLVICKTRAAVEVFSKRGCRTAFSSFTSVDRRTAPSAPKRPEFLMIIGNIFGIPERVLDLWARHPEWPRLTLSGRFIPPNVNLPNVRLIRDFISAGEIARLQNECQFHLCVTAAEGFGHKFNEGFSCGAIIVATDAPPMNEIVQPDRGLLVKWDRTNPLRLGTEYHFDAADLERTIENALRLTPAQITAMTSNAKAWFEDNDRFFRKQFPRIVNDLMDSSA